MAEPGPHGLLDTSVLIDIDKLSAEVLPATWWISAITVAELAAGPNATNCTRLWPGLYGNSLCRRKPRGARAIDLLIAAVALANGLPLYTRIPADFTGLEELVDVVPC